MIPLMVMRYDVDQLFEPEILFRAIKPKTLLTWACYYILLSVTSKTKYNSISYLPTYLYNAICSKFILPFKHFFPCCDSFVDVEFIVLSNVIVVKQNILETNNECIYKSQKFLTILYPNGI